ncbi:hypothetical protein JCM30237_10910 [Halolamina litorea]|uniref:NrS-1 polymerase-like HBD domain-containing protein n=1 Tax=Halolamina litorea TaxID=1515593 RepID=A0ABD6BV34_9EURY|nr:hypothetical protein [Halolamina litorea]
MINVDAIPEELQEVPQWLCWSEQVRDGKQTKVPLDPQTGSYASVTDPGTWGPFQVATEAATDDSVAGIGFVFTDDDPFVGVDLDDCRDAETGSAEPWARDLLTRLDSFTEVSPSGTGFHVYVRGVLPAGGNRSGSLECYESSRFFTVTGDWVAGTPENVHERTAALQAMHTEHIATSVPSTASIPDEVSTTIADETLLSKAMNAKNGEKFTRLWNGNTSGYDSQSEADMALCFLLAFWTGRDPSQMDRLFRQSGLYRAKWDDRHYGDGRTYGEGTLERAVQGTTDVYEPPRDEYVEQPEVQPTDALSASPEANRHEPIPSEVVNTVSELTTTVAELNASFEALEAQHDYLYDELQSERQAREKAQKRLKTLEQAVTEQQQSWLQRLF